MPPHTAAAGYVGRIAPLSATESESAWERGLRTAKEMMRKANKRKELDIDFDEKKMNISGPPDEIERDPYYHGEPDVMRKRKLLKINKHYLFFFRFHLRLIVNELKGVCHLEVLWYIVHPFLNSLDLDHLIMKRINMGECHDRTASYQLTECLIMK